MNTECFYGIYIGGNHYEVLADAPGSSFQGMGGRRFVIELAGGRIVETRNLWYRGSTNKADNARFLGGAGYVEFKEPEKGEPGLIYTGCFQDSGDFKVPGKK